VFSVVCVVGDCILGIPSESDKRSPGFLGSIRIPGCPSFVFDAGVCLVQCDLYVVVSVSLLPLSGNLWLVLGKIWRLSLGLYGAFGDIVLIPPIVSSIPSLSWR